MMSRRLSRESIIHRVIRTAGFEEHSLPLGCGYMGVNVWGGTDTEAIYVTENSLANPYQEKLGE